jgi:hypothetical protein
MLGEFRCHNGECISSYHRCDGQIDCSGQEDEVNCGKKGENHSFALLLLFFNTFKLYKSHWYT